MNEMIYPYDLKEAIQFFIEDHPSYPIYQICGEADGIIFKGKYSAYKYFYEGRNIEQLY